MPSSKKITTKLPKFFQVFLEPEVKTDFIIQKTVLALIIIIFFYLPLRTQVDLLEVLPFMLYAYIWYMLTYSLAYYLKPEKDSYHRWLLFFANFLLLPLPMILALKFSESIKNKYAQKTSIILTTLIIWWLISNFFSFTVITFASFLMA